MNRMIIVGSPRANGRSAHLAEELFESCIEQYPQDEVYLVPVSELEIGPCIGCGACRRMAAARKNASSAADFVDAKQVEEASGAQAGEAPSEQADEQVDAQSEEALSEQAPEYPTCIFDDDMQDVYELLPSVDELIIVSPVYFSGAPSSMKALLDRLQPYFWTEARHEERRPATLHIIGEGHDPCGFNALISEVKSATLVAGFELNRVLSWVGRLDEKGEIVSDPEVVLDSETADSETPAEQADASDEIAAAKKPRPKLSFSASMQEDSREVTQASEQHKQQKKPKQASSDAERGGKPTAHAKAQGGKLAKSSASQGGKPKSSAASRGGKQKSSAASRGSKQTAASRGRQASAKKGVASSKQQKSGKAPSSKGAKKGKPRG